MKLNIPLHKRIHQLFCKHKDAGWSSCTRGINSKEGYEYVNYECIDCGVSIGEWHKKGEWDKLDFPPEYTIQNKRIRNKKFFKKRRQNPDKKGD
ncbi:hypothetical protein GTY48_15665 [Bacillus thuringiensis]|uniref:hypothetical protein n=1 Tax=Bacillus cereus group TaxID=86661 RepID=UPI000BECDD1C|nr:MULTISPECIES: hypothetical protein [Bacillus cereus group]MYW25005.1 hypothetical protein [Bacillus thuringiensis]MYW25084.1 hypothetical protein [Bacillus thuringiensis]PEE38357.1 hypothetical protein CON59_05235 [Bacillus cereus]PET42025.1 hypothetical protein CN523_22435 [Bacillus cereus]PFA59143.1 hypothetical protein CN389_04505 [Bacillus cereus]